MSSIGIDIGASYIKGAVLDLEERKLKKVIREPFPGFLGGLPDGRREVSCRAIEAVVDCVMDGLHRSAEAIDRILISNQMHGFVLCNEHGESCGHFVSWQDKRTLQGETGKSYYESLRARVPGDYLASIGNELKPGHPNVVLAWLRSQGLLPKGAVACSLGDYIASKITGAYPVTDPTNAAGMGLLDVRRGVWHEGLLDFLGIRDLRLPEIRSVLDEGVKAGCVRVQAPVGDQQASLVGCGLQPRELSVNIATGSQVAIIADECSLGTYQSRPFFDGRYLKTVTHIPAGRALNVLMRLFAECLVARGVNDTEWMWDYVLKEANLSTPMGLNVDLSFFPCVTGAKGCISGLCEENMSIGMIFRATLESMADNYARFSSLIDSPRTAERIAFSGGIASKVPLLRRLIIDRLNLPCRDIISEEDALNGLLALELCRQQGQGLFR